MRSPKPSTARELARTGARALLRVVLTLAAVVPSASGVAADPPALAGSELFVRMATVFQHPRCMNCHTGEPFPRQGDDAHRHGMNVSRGAADQGAAGLHCNTCHQSSNQLPSGVPGAPSWQLAPLRMKWAGLSVGELCHALQDPTRGGMAPSQFAPHFQTALVRWAWNPGNDVEDHPRATPPLAYDEFIELAGRWVAAGTPCPP